MFRRGEKRQAGRSEPDPDGSGSDPRQALQELRGRVHRAWTPQAVDAMVSDLRLLGDILPILGADGQVAADVVAAANAPQDPIALFQAGYQLIEVGLSEHAAGPLASSLAIRPDAGTVLELVCALEASESYGQVVSLFTVGHPWAQDMGSPAVGLLAHSAAMSGDMELLRTLLPKLPPDEEGWTFRALAVERLQRYDALQPSGRPSGDGDLRAWDAILHGMLLLATDGRVMNGREGVIWDSPDQFKAALGVLREALELAGRQPRWVHFAPDRDSAILAHVLARLLPGVVAPVPIGVDAPGDSIVVAFAWSRADLDMIARERQGSAIRFGYWTDWTQVQMAPHITAVEAQMLYPVWGERLQVTPGDPGAGITTIPADERDPDVIAQEILGTSGLPTLSELFPDEGDSPNQDRDDVAEILDVMMAADAPFGLQGLPVGSRRKYYPGGPVTSSRFF